MAVQVEGGWLLHCGDAYYRHSEMETPPSCPRTWRAFQQLNGFDGAARDRNQERLRDLARDHDDKVRLVCSHDPAQLDAAG